MSTALDEVITTAQLVPLSQAVEVNPKIDRTALHDDLDVSFVPMAAVEALSGGIDVSTVRKYGDVKKGYTHFRDGDILFAKVTPCMENGKMAIARKLVNGVGFGSTEFHVLRPRAGVDARYVYYFVSSQTFRKDASGHMTGAVGLRRVPSAYLEEQSVLLPDIEQQREIVSELEKQFSRLDEAVANLLRVKANLKRYKASVLKDAVEGRLVPTEAELARREGRRFETGEQLLQRILEKRRDQWSRSGAYKTPLNRSNEKPGELPEGWVWSTYEQLGRMQLGRQRSPKYHNGPNMRPYLRVQNVFEDRIDLSDVMEMEFNASDFEKYQLATGDLLLNEGQSPELLGRPAIYRGELPGACFTNTLIRFRAAEGVSVEFALHLSRHYMLAGRFVDEGTITTNIAHLSLGRLATVEFPLPPFAEQKRIVEEVERRLSLVRSVQTEVDANLKRAQALRQSVLSKSFVSP